MDLTSVRQQLMAARTTAQADLERIDRALAALGASSAGAVREKATESLRDVILRVLQSSREPLPLTQLAQAVKTAGFPTRSRNFRSNVSGMLTQMVRARQVRRTPQGYVVARSSSIQTPAARSRSTRRSRSASLG